MKHYEGLFILKNTAREEALKETIDKISAEIAAVGGKIETVQKMDKKAFSRVADRKNSSGFYVNILFESEPDGIGGGWGEIGGNQDSLQTAGHFRSTRSHKHLRAERLRAS